jgi:hypothetical protein
MALSLHNKLRIKEGMTLLSINAPAEFAETIEPLSANVKISSRAKNFDQIHWFVKTRAEMENQFSAVHKLIKDDLLCWIYYPKGSSGMQTDLTRDKGWEMIMRYKDLQWINLVSFNDTWSTFAVRARSETDRKKAAEPKQRAIFDYIDPAKKTIRLPEDLEKLLSKNKKAAVFFNTLSFTNKKEYLEWIVTAKKEETRNERLKGTIERLEKNWKNPRNI